VGDHDLGESFRLGLEIDDVSSFHFAFPVVTFKEG
jgi:hypothetical protein